MSTRIRTRLSLNFLAVLCIGMSLAGTFAWITVEKQYLDTQRQSLLAMASVTAERYRADYLLSLIAEPYSQTANAAPGIHVHVLEAQNDVVLVTPVDMQAPIQPVPPAENSGPVSAQSLIQRAEVASAMKGTPATAIRRVASAGNRRVLYAAAPIFSEKNQIIGVVYLATPLPAGGLPLVTILELGGAVLAAGLLAWFAGVLFARRLARPIEAVAAAAGKVAEGDLDQRVPVGGGVRELDSLGASFNAMTTSLRRSEQARNDFIADVTHELRTPLTVFKGTLETLDDGALEDPEGRGPLLEAMHKETDRLIRLVNDLLVLTRFDAGALKLNLQPLDLAGLARARGKPFTRLARQRKVTLTVESAGPARLAGDPDRLAEVLDNLLDNALRHSPAGTRVSVRLEGQGNWIVCAVMDQGNGIAPEHLPYIFERFYRAESARDRRSGGSGLGLAIVRALVQAHGGRVEAESELGQGTTVRFFLPAASGLPQD